MFGLATCLTALAGAGTASAQQRGLSAFGAGPRAAYEGQAVDVELVLAVDVSWSMDIGEQRIQRDGYVAAFRSADVQRAITEGGHGRVAVTYVEWAGSFSQSVVVPWTLIDSREAADAFAYRLSGEEPARARRTSIASAIDYSAGLFSGNGFAGVRKVIDVSGDGPNNEGRTVTDSRDDAAALGITVNGLPLMTSGKEAGGTDRVYLGWGAIPDLDRYYSNCVIGGPGAFMIPVNDWAQFPEAVRRKLVLELAGRWPEPRRAPLPLIRTQGAGGYDCLIGEKMWQNRQQRWMDDR